MTIVRPVSPRRMSAEIKAAVRTREYAFLPPFQTAETSGAYRAATAKQTLCSASIYGTSLGRQGQLRTPTRQRPEEEAAKLPITARFGKQPDLYHMQEEARAWCSGHYHLLELSSASWKPSCA